MLSFLAIFRVAEMRLSIRTRVRVGRKEPEAGHGAAPHPGRRNRRACHGRHGPQA